MVEENKYDKYLKYVGGVRFWIVSTGVIVMFAALKEARSVVNIILLAMFLTAISLAPLNWLKKKGVPRTMAALIVIFTVIFIAALNGFVIEASVNGFVKKIPVYEEKFKEMWVSAEDELAHLGLINEDGQVSKQFQSKTLLPMAAPIASGLGTVFSGAIVIFILFIFMIFEAEMFSKKMKYVSSDSSKHADKILKQLRNYFGIKTLTSLATGIAIGIMMWILGVDFPVLWGFLAFILNYIPSIGSFIAAIPAVLLTFVMQGPLSGFVAIVGYFVINTLIGNVIEPQLMGRNLGISPLIVFVSMIFYGFILGPIGMLIATPLAIVIKIIFDSREVTKSLGIMLSDGRDLEFLNGQASPTEKE